MPGSSGASAEDGRYSGLLERAKEQLLKVDASMEYWRGAGAYSLGATMRHALWINFVRA